MEYDMLEHILDGKEKPTNLPFALLREITENFSEEREIGQGGFGTVYKGVLRNGNVAVKRIMNNHTIDEKLFYREVDSLLKVNHKNVVRFLGFCANTEQIAMKIEGKREYIYAEIRERLLCFEYISNGSLQKYITDELRGLEWIARYHIIRGLCEGLYHLHMENHIIHMDLKPTNVLLNHQMVPKITGFGLSRLAETTQTMTANRFLSLGYCAPEYLHGGRMSVKSDIYSLGVIIIELVTGHKSIPDHNNVLRRWRHRWKKSAKETPLGYQQVTKCIGIGLRCQENDPYRRPFIGDVLHDIIEIGGISGQISNTSGSTIAEVIPAGFSEFLDIHPPELRFTFEPNKLIPCSLHLMNNADEHVAFKLMEKSRLIDKRCFLSIPLYGIVPLRSIYTLVVTTDKRKSIPEERNVDFVLQNSIGDKHLKPFRNQYDCDRYFEKVEELRNMVHNVTLKVVYAPQGEMTCEVSYFK